MVNFNRLKKQLIIDKGFKTKVYKDSKGLPTVGIGHLVLPSDNLKLGDTITKAKAEALFLEDIAIATIDATIIFEGVWEKFPAIAQEVFINMLFNLGRARFLGFKRMISAAHNRDWENVAKEMADSKWAKKDVPSRAARLRAKIEELSANPHE